MPPKWRDTQPTVKVHDMLPHPLGHLCLNPLDARLSIGERDVGDWHTLDLSGCRDAKRLKRMGRRRS